MTTIAWDGKMLAGDSFADRGGLKHHVETKIFRLNDGSLYGGSGNWADVLAVRDALNCDPAGWPAGIDDYSGLFVDRDGRCMVLGCRQPGHPSPFPFFAVGSGRDFAIAAMHCGRNAKEAVELAREYDTYTGGPITVLELEP